MPNIIYNTFWQKVLSGECAWNDDYVVRGLLVDSSSTYTPNKDHQTIQAMKQAGLVEVSTDTGYKRGTVPDKTVQIIEVNGDTRPALQGGPIHFGAIEEGVTIKAIVLFVRVGLTDQDSVDYPVCYVDDHPSLPKDTTGAVVMWNPGTNGFIGLAPCA